MVSQLDQKAGLAADPTAVAAAENVELVVGHVRAGGDTPRPIEGGECE